MAVFENILSLPEGPKRTAALVAWVQGMYDTYDEKPVLVGGAAVELYTGGGYTTGDLDFAGIVPQLVAESLVEAGFDRRGRHWIHDEGEIFIEFPSSGLGSDEESIVLEVEGQRVLVVEPEALVADRLAAWQIWQSPEDGVNAWLITRSHSLDMGRVVTLAEAKGVSWAASELAGAIERWRERDPTEEELVAWAREIPQG